MKVNGNKTISKTNITKYIKFNSRVKLVLTDCCVVLAVLYRFVMTSLLVVVLYPGDPAQVAAGFHNQHPRFLIHSWSVISFIWVLVAVVSHWFMSSYMFHNILLEFRYISCSN